jgi:general secretion pathway protein A
LPQLSSLQQRPVVQVTLAPLTDEESLEYIRHRLTKVLMPEDAVLSSGALKRLIRAARGNPRALNTLCARLLTAGATRQQKPVSAGMAREVLANRAARRKWAGFPWKKALTR